MWPMMYDRVIQDGHVLLTQFLIFSSGIAVFFLAQLFCHDFGKFLTV